MKKYIVLLLIILISASPLFRGLFFPLERSFFFTIISALSGIYFIIKIYKKEEIKLNNWLIYLNALFVLSYIISTFVAVDYKGAIDAIVQYAMYFIILIIFIDFFKSNKGKIKTYFCIPLVSFGVIVAIVSLAGYAGGLEFLEDVVLGDRLGATLQYTNTAGIYFLMCILLNVSLLLQSRSMLTRVLLAGIGNILCIALFFTGSRGVFVLAPFIIFIVFIVFMPRGYKNKSLAYLSIILLPLIVIAQKYYIHSNASNYFDALKWVMLSLVISVFLAILLDVISKLPRKVMLAIYSMALVGLLLLIAFQYSMLVVLAEDIISKLVPENILGRLQTISMNEINLIARIDFDKDAIKLIKEYPLFGTGGGGWISLYQSVQDYYYIARTVHNHYLQVFVEAGVFGFISFLGLVLLSLYNYIKSAYSADMHNRILVSGMASAFIALAAHTAMDFNLTYGSIAMIFWLLIAMSTSLIKEVGK